jgi:hypothetical protein
MSLLGGAIGSIGFFRDRLLSEPLFCSAVFIANFLLLSLCLLLEPHKPSRSLLSLTMIFII